MGEWPLGEDGFGLCVLVGLPGEHAEGVALEPVVVEAFAGVVVVEVPVGGFGRGSKWFLDCVEGVVGFGEGSEVFWSVVAADPVFGGLV